MGQSYTRMGLGPNVGGASYALSNTANNYTSVLSLSSRKSKPPSVMTSVKNSSTSQILDVRSWIMKL